ncbi:hypothetical protein OUZ56_017053 [Daphnia magna]|uniref:Uncharacterized protein n=1 Tax=Daphnia magna TaxID=35525 RepID=A0ABR0AS16_9CRUS|nr:hypothetical protein OUZ56_017053 [Daphnia magna]
MCRVPPTPPRVKEIERLVVRSTQGQKELSAAHFSPLNSSLNVRNRVSRGGTEATVELWYHTDRVASVTQDGVFYPKYT